MPATIYQETWAGRTEKGALVQNSQISRKIKDATWQVLNLGIRMSWANDTGASPPAGCIWSMGLWNGPSNMAGDATRQHGIVTGSFGTTWTNGGLTRQDYGNILSLSGNNRIGKWENNAFTNGTLTLSTFWKAPDPAGAPTDFYNNVCILQIDRSGGSPYACRTLYCNSSAVARVSQATFLAQVESVTPAITSHGWSAATNLAIDEGTYGALEFFNFWWNVSAPSAFIQDVAVVRIS